MDRISFLVPLYNAERTVADTLTSIFAQQTEGVELEIIVVDDGSADRSVAVVEGFDAGITLLRKEHGGEASALNEGLKHCSGNFVALVEADVEIYPDWLGVLLPEFEDPRVMGAGGHLVTPKQDPWIARLVGYEVEMKLRGRGKYVPHLTSANVLYRRDAFVRFGCFDEHLMNASLDAEFNRRIVMNGGTLVYCPDAHAVHHYKSTVWSYLQRHYAYARYRRYVEVPALYPADRWLAWNVGLCGMGVLSLALLPLRPEIPLIALCLTIFIQIPSTFRLWRRYRDRALWMGPPVVWLRNVVAFMGYIRGMIALWTSDRAYRSKA